MNGKIPGPRPTATRVVLTFGAAMAGMAPGLATGQPQLEPGGVICIAEDSLGASHPIYLSGGSGNDFGFTGVTLASPVDLGPVTGVDWFQDHVSLYACEEEEVQALTLFGDGSVEPSGIWGTGGTILVATSVLLDSAVGFEDPFISFEDPIISFEDPFISQKVALWETGWSSFEDPFISFDGIDGESRDFGRPFLRAAEDGLFLADADDELMEPVLIPGTDGMSIVAATAFPPGSVGLASPGVTGQAGAAFISWDGVSAPAILGIWGTGGALGGTGGQLIWGTGGTIVPITDGGFLVAPTSMVSWPAKWMGLDDALFVTDAGAGALRGGAPARIIGVGVDGTQRVAGEGDLLVNPQDIAIMPDGMLIVADPDAAGGDGALILVDPATGDQDYFALGGEAAGFYHPVAVSVLVCTPPTYVVNSAADFVDPNPGDGDPSDGLGNVCVRSAVMEANASPCAGGAIVEVPAGSFGLSLAGPDEENAAASGDLDITGYVRLRGAGPSMTTIDANQIDRVFHVQAGATLALADIEITGGDPNEGGGGGVRNEGSLSITNVHVRQNHGAGGGGGVVNNGGDVIAIDCEIENNSSGANGGGVGSGGGIGSTPSLLMARSLVASNAADLNGAGVSAFAGTADLVNCTIVYNTSVLSGGGLSTNGTGADARLDHCSIVSNTADDEAQGGASGGGLANLGGAIGVGNSIVAKNETGLLASQNASGTIDSLGYDLFSDTSGFAITGDTATVIVGTALIGPPADHGGRTRTAAISSQSPAIDAADPGGSIVEDQRLVARPQDGDGDATARSDIGAYEYAPPACPGDIDADGDTDVFDFGEFAVHFGASVPFNEDGDLDGDGQVTVFDFGIFAIDFGCTS